MRPLTLAQILAWADAYHDQAGDWPQSKSGKIAGTVCETWREVDRCLQQGLRGLAGGSALDQLLAEQRGVRRKRCLPPLTESQILAWADDYFQRTGSWPTRGSGLIANTPYPATFRISP